MDLNDMNELTSTVDEVPVFNYKGPGAPRYKGYRDPDALASRRAAGYRPSNALKVGQPYPTVDPTMHIKQYPNRKYYDPNIKRYVHMGYVAELILKYPHVRVFKWINGVMLDDTTQKTLLGYYRQLVNAQLENTSNEKLIEIIRAHKASLDLTK